MSERWKQPERFARRRGLSLVEVSISTLLVGLILVTSMRTVGAVLQQRTSFADNQRANLLAEQLMSEILEKEYLEPVATPGFGTETGEGSTSRTSYDDVDDYHNWVAAPPEYRDGTEISGLYGWQRDCVVDWVSPSNLTVSTGSDQGLKRITIKVRKNGVVLAHLQSIRADRD